MQWLKQAFFLKATKGSSCGYEKTSGALEIYGKMVLELDLSKHFPAEFMCQLVIL